MDFSTKVESNNFNRISFDNETKSKEALDIVKKCEVVDLFCGIGGLTHGFIKQSFSVKAGIDNDKSCRYAYEANNNSLFIEKDVNICSTRRYSHSMSKVYEKCDL